MRKLDSRLVWASVALALLAACFLLGRQDAVGHAPMATVLLSFFILCCTFVLIRQFPFVRRANVAIVLLALLARALLLPLQHSDDVYRYVWEGRLVWAGLNPYVVAPEDEEADGLHDENRSKINHPDKTAIYAPGALLLFAGWSALTTELFHFKLLSTAFDLLTLLTILRLLGEVGRKKSWALLYAVNPVVLLAFAGEGHLDSAMVFFMMLAAYLFHRKRWVGMFVCIGMAIQIKYVAVLLVPFLVRRENLRWVWCFLLVAVVPFALFRPLPSVAHSLVHFSTEMHFNGSLHRVLGMLTGSYPLASSIGARALAAWLLVVLFIARRPLEAGTMVLGVLLLFAPTVHFWYLAWVIPFLCFYPVRGWVAWCATVTLTFFTIGRHLETGVWTEYSWVTWLEYAPVYGLLLFDLARNRRLPALSDREPARPLSTVSVVVPVLNEAGRLPGLLASLANLEQAPIEVIVCDAGSADGSREAARAGGARVVTAPLGRGRQIAAGVAESRGDIVFVAHADMHLAPDAFGRLLLEMNRTGATGGCLGCRFDRSGFLLGTVSLLNTIRARFFGIAFGDQGQFFRMDRLGRVGGFPDLMIMEDVELSLRLINQDRPLYVGGGVTASARKWEARVPFRHALLIVGLVAQYLILRGLRGPHVDVQPLYRRYYGPA